MERLRSRLSDLQAEAGFNTCFDASCARAKRARASTPGSEPEEQEPEEPEAEEPEDLGATGAMRGSASTPAQIQTICRKWAREAMGILYAWTPTREDHGACL